jgi:hypothetical protein
MNRYWERKISGFVVFHKKSKFWKSEMFNPIDLETAVRYSMSDSIYDALIIKECYMSGWKNAIDAFNHFLGEELFALEKIEKEIIIKTENMFG